MFKVLEQLKKRRKELGLTQVELANKLNITQPQYQKIENNGNPSLVKLEAIAMALKMRVMLVPNENVAEVEDLLGQNQSVVEMQSLSERFRINE